MRIHPRGTLVVKFHNTPSNSYKDVSPTTTNVNGGAREKSHRGHQSVGLCISSGDHECLHGYTSNR